MISNQKHALNPLTLSQEILRFIITTILNDQKCFKSLTFSQEITFYH